MTFLDDIPDMQGMDFPALDAWVGKTMAAIQGADYSLEVMKSFTPVELAHVPENPYGPEASADWRRFFLATLLADWVCYDHPFDRIDFPRLQYIMSSAWQHFRLWCCTLPDGRTLPVAYSAWYPISRFIYDGLLDNADQITDRGAFLPLRYVEAKDIRYGYALNVSIVKPLRNTFCSTRLIRSYQRDALRLKHINAVTITVDEAGKRISRMSDFTHLGDVTIQGHAESLFVREALEA
jgi:hypothetical protein